MTKKHKKMLADMVSAMKSYQEITEDTSGEPEKRLKSILKSTIELNNIFYEIFEDLIVPIDQSVLDFIVSANAKLMDLDEEKESGELIRKWKESKRSLGEAYFNNLCRVKHESEENPMFSKRIRFTT